MKEQPSFIGNVWKGILLRLNNLFSGSEKSFKISGLYEKFLKHIPAGRIHTHKLMGKKVSFGGGPEYLHALKEIFVDNIYNQPLPENAYIIDCGAHIGISVIFIKQICPTAEIDCFEPDQKNYQLLIDNISSFALHNVRAHNKAVWIDNSVINFSMEGNMSSRITNDQNSNQSVQACRLLDLMDRKIDFLKIDIEGAEYEVLKDIEPKLENVQKLFIEYHGAFDQNSELVDILSILVRNNFHFYIKEAAPVYEQPFTGRKAFGIYDLQLNIFCIKNSFTFQNN